MDVPFNAYLASCLIVAVLSFLYLGIVQDEASRLYSE